MQRDQKETCCVGSTVGVRAFPHLSLLKKYTEEWDGYMKKEYCHETMSAFVAFNQFQSVMLCDKEFVEGMEKEEKENGRISYPREDEEPIRFHDKMSKDSIVYDESLDFKFPKQNERRFQEISFLLYQVFSLSLSLSLLYLSLSFFLRLF